MEPQLRCAAVTIAWAEAGGAVDAPASLHQRWQQPTAAADCRRPVTHSTQSCCIITTTSRHTQPSDCDRRRAHPSHSATVSVRHCWLIESPPRPFTPIE